MKASRGVIYEVLREFTEDYREAILSEWCEIYGISDCERDELHNFSEYSVSDILDCALVIAEECEHELHKKSKS